ncbi:MAG: four helix bundle protein [Planctomycetes bacterium]|nr:four helix bundle protein [Planctomycetota bacterium]
MTITKFEEIEAWTEARSLAKTVYEATRTDAFRADPDLRRQMRRAAVSAMANIAEGFDGGSNREFARFLRLARRSASELQSHLYLCMDQDYISGESFDSLYSHARKVKELIGGFLRYLASAPDPRNRGSSRSKRET